jgi:hypothetical protein
MKITIDLSNQQACALLSFAERLDVTPTLSYELTLLKDAMHTIRIQLGPFAKAENLCRVAQINHELDDAIREFHDGPPGAAEDQPAGQS